MRSIPATPPYLCGAARVRFLEPLGTASPHMPDTYATIAASLMAGKERL
ncbi:MAG: hypothetical protein ACJ8CR_34205 [Roseiflexaceae bacterium]